jgi:hypothetical protein
MRTVHVRELDHNAQLAADAILGKPSVGVPTWNLNIMEHRFIDRIAGTAPGEYLRNPRRVYLQAQRAIGVCMIDQYIPENPLTMEAHGYEGKEKGATTGADEVVLDVGVENRQVTLALALPML